MVHETEQSTRAGVEDVTQFLSDFGAWMGDTVRKTQVAKRLVAQGITHEQLLVLRRYFSSRTGMDDVGGFVASRMEKKTQWRDLVNDIQAREAYAAKAAALASGEGVNLSFDGSSASVREDSLVLTAETRLKVQVRRLAYHVLDLKWSYENAGAYEKPPLTASQAQKFVELARSDHPDARKFCYVRQKDRPAWLKSPQWKKGKKPLPLDDDPADNKLPDDLGPERRDFLRELGIILGPEGAKPEPEADSDDVFADKDEISWADVPMYGEEPKGGDG